MVSNSILLDYSHSNDLTSNLVNSNLICLFIPEDWLENVNCFVFHSWLRIPYLASTHFDHLEISQI